MSFVAAAVLLALVTSVACAIPGALLVLRRQSMLVDAISHATLPGIVAGIMITGTLHSPWMILLATLSGLIVVWAAHALTTTGTVIGDASQGAVFPVMFAVGVLMLSTLLADVHVDTSIVLNGDINLMALPSEHIVVGGYDIGAAAMWELIAVLVLDLLYIAVFHRVFVASTFDPHFSRVAGLPVAVATNLLMLLVTITAVAAFSAAGSVLVVALMICPAATALVFAKTMPQVMGWTLIIAVFSGVGGFFVAWWLDVPTAAMMSCFNGLIFVGVLFVATIVRKARSSGVARVSGQS